MPPLIHIAEHLTLILKPKPKIKPSSFITQDNKPKTKKGNTSVILKMFSVFDSKANAYLQPFFAPSAGVAIRNFSDACNQEDHGFHQHAGDFTLFEIGQFDQESGGFQTLKTPINLGLAITFIATEESQPELKILP